MLPTRKHRIALISVDGDPAAEIGQEEAGGQNVYVRQVGYALAEQGWQVDMFTRQSSPEQATIVQHGPLCRTIRLKTGSTEFIGRDHLFEHLPEFIAEFQTFQREQGFQYRLIHTNYWLSSWVGMELKKQQPLIQLHTYHSLGTVKYSAISDIPAIASKRIAVEKACLETVDRVVATSPQEQQHMRRLVSTKGKIEVIPCGTDVDKFGLIQRSAARQELGIAPDVKMILYVGRFDQRKGIETLVRAVAKSSLRDHANLQLVIGGGYRPGHSDGIERDRIASIVAELGLQDCTTFPGRLDEAVIPSYYAAADVCVVPSHYEPFGLVAIEAMASQTPVVASDVGGLQFTVVPEVTGLLVPPKDEVAFATAIDRILLNPNWRDQLGEAGRQRVEIAFSWYSVASRLTQIYTHLLAQTMPSIESKPQIAA
ncbi:glycosyltransferase family 1 protein [Brasilonema octagenarum UFV-E1]|uniref:Glycosyltransferase family 1 protein n=1 Tax=Brasilonema sennae CENA114 TaxID=415709 RepID=A0A856MMP5_9CYAN|nr:glycosyltransferase [Brasilonema sennae]QDL10196.1 glycosyltransferase family 1 protein [Brasilonema sennae CENA114]QDL16548.1 glycosyltransferase family 1 protein [Brasilonema octagenarum UFV-E1]